MVKEGIYLLSSYFIKQNIHFFHITRACLFQGNASSVAVLAMIVCKAALALWKDKEDDKERVLMEKRYW